MNAGLWGFLGVVVGGVLTIGGQATAELLSGRMATTQRRERREQLHREFQRETLISLQAAMARYRAALSRDRAFVLPTPESEEQLSAARVEYQMLVHRLASQPARDAVLAWEVAALGWFQGDDTATAAAEAGAWDSAMLVTGRIIGTLA